MVTTIETASKTPEQSEEIALIPLDVVNDMSGVQTQLLGALADYIGFQVDTTVEQLGENDPEAQDKELMDKFGIGYKPGKTLRGLGGYAVIGFDPRFLKEEMLREEISMVDTGALADNGVQEESEPTEKTKDELDAEFSAALEAENARATAMIYSLLSVDSEGNINSGALSGLPQEWIDSLSARAKTRLEEFNGDIHSIPPEEIAGMISVASIGLAKTKYGMEFGNY